MNKTSQFVRVLSVLVILTIILSNVQLPTVSAQRDDGIKREFNAESGKVSFIGAENGASVAFAEAMDLMPGALPSRSTDPAMALAKRFAPEFGLRDAERDLTSVSRNKAENGRLTVRYQQEYQGIPVMGGELIVNTNDRGELYSINGEVSPNLSLTTQPTIDSAQARQIALEAMAKWNQSTPEDFIATEPQLWIFDESLLRPSTRPATLVWRMDISSADGSLPIRELMLINAQTGNPDFHFNQIDTAWHVNGSTGRIDEPESTPTPLPTETPTPTETPLPVEATSELPISTETPLPKATDEPIDSDNTPTESVTNGEAKASSGLTWYVAPTGSDSNSCFTANAPCQTIQAAIDKAAPEDHIKVAKGIYTGTSTPILGIDKNITISGGWNSTFNLQKGMSILDGQKTYRTVMTTANTTVTIEHLMIINSADAGITAYRSTLILNYSTVTNSSGSGLSVDGSLYLNNSTVTRNTGSEGAGMVLRLTDGVAYINNSTITSNIADKTGGGIKHYGSGNIKIKNSILYNNTAEIDGQDCHTSGSGSTISEGHNILGSTDDCSITITATDQINIDPLLSDWLSVGYLALLPDSPAINAGDASTCLSTDQRGAVRDSICDIGAIEHFTAGPATDVVIQFGDNQRVTVNGDLKQPLEALVLDGIGNPVNNATVSFTAPLTGASGVFIGSDSSVASSTTNMSGIATAPTFKSNNLIGSYKITANVTGAPTSAHFSLTNMGWYVSTTGSNSNSCASPSAPCATIQQAVNKAYPGDTIFVAEGIYKTALILYTDQYFNFSGGWNTDFSARTTRSILDGAGIDDLARGDIVFEHFVIQNSTSSGIATQYAKFTLIDSIVQNNTTAYFGGAGISGRGEVEIIDSLITNNTNNSTALYPGGGIYIQGKLTLINTTVSNNKSSHSNGGGIYIAGGNAIINNSTITKNYSVGHGGGIGSSFSASVSINNSTIAYNMAQSGGGVAFFGSPNAFNVIRIENSIIANNSANDMGQDCYSSGHAFNILHYSLIGNSADCSAVSETGNLKNITPKISSILLGWPGYYPLESTSPAVNTGAPVESNTCLPTDQRGISRNTPCDMGSFEYMAPLEPHTIKIINGSTQTATPGSFFSEPLKVLITDIHDNLVNGVTVSFTAPPTGASITFSNTLSNISSSITQSDGFATSSNFYANNQAGAYSISAIISGTSITTDFQLKNFEFWYVATTGNNLNDCMTPMTPCGTVGGVLSKSHFWENEFIRLAGGIYQDTSPSEQIITLGTSTSLSGGWDSGFTIQNQTSVIDGQGIHRGVRILNGINAVIDHITVSNGHTEGTGGGIWNEGNLIISNSIIEDNQASSGGGIYNAGTLTIKDSIIQMNSASIGGGIHNATATPFEIIRTTIMRNQAWRGGGIYHDVGILAYVGSSTLFGNSAEGGGGIYVDGGMLTLNSSSVVYNVATTFLDVSFIATGGGIHLDSGQALVNNSTISSNYATGYGGGIYNAFGSLRLRNATVSFNITPLDGYGAGLFQTSDYSYQTTIAMNSIIALNSDGKDCHGNLTSAGYNLVGNNSFCNYTGAVGDLIGTTEKPINPLLSMPRDNGGGILTNALFTDSPAQNAGNVAEPGSSETACFITDQRGESRGNSDRCDMGAFEGTISPMTESNVAVFTDQDEAREGVLSNFLCGPLQIPCTNVSYVEADQAQVYAIEFIKFYDAIHQRNSIDNLGLPIFISVDYLPESRCRNALWDAQILLFCDGMVADDILAHELTHGVTYYESQLFYLYQSGAISESFSDLWGEYFDQTNEQGNDRENVKWLIGEDAEAISVVRNMKHPPQFGDPDTMTSALYNKKSYYDPDWDNGGVHSNSGVNNKAVYLMVDGGAFNGKTIKPLGWEKVGAIYYEVNTNLLSSGSDYSDLYYALQQACRNLTGQHGITSADCSEVRNAVDAVQMNSQPITNFSPDASLCPTGMTTNSSFRLYQEDFESTISNWTLTAWQSSSLYTASGNYSLWGNDQFRKRVGALSMQNGTVLPANSTIFLHFKHAFGFDHYKSNYYDGGVLEYSVNNGSTWIDAKLLFSGGQDYNGTVYKYPYEPDGSSFQGKSAFVGDSHGYVSSRYNLTSLAGKTVKFRWRFATDKSDYYLGWFVDDVSIYKCIGTPSVPTMQLPVNNAAVKNYVPLLDWSNAKSVDHYELQVATDSAFTSLVYNELNLPASQFQIPANLASNTKYFWRVRGVNGIGTAGKWTAPFAFRAVPLAPDGLSPIDGFVARELRPAFDWNAPPGPGAITSYTLQFSKNIEFTQIVHTGTSTGSEYVPTANLPKNTTLYWRVLAKGTNGSSAYSAIRSIVMPVNPPPTPLLLSPADNAVVREYTNPTLTWKPVTFADASFQHYQVQVATDAAFSNRVLDNTDVTSRTTGQLVTTLTLTPDTRYYWRVRAVNIDDEVSNWSTVSRIRAAIPAPTLTAPSNAATEVSRKPLLDWENVPGNNGYVLQVWKGTTLVKTVTLSPDVSQYQFLTNLLANTTYTWKVQTKGNVASSTWSQFTFKTGQ